MNRKKAQSEIRSNCNNLLQNKKNLTIILELELMSKRDGNRVVKCNTIKVLCSVEVRPNSSTEPNVWSVTSMNTLRAPL